MQKARSRRAFLVAAGATATASLSGCLGVFERDAFDIGMTASAFTPRTFSVPVGTTVVWRNTSTRSHTVTAYEATLPEGATFFATGGYDSEAAAREAWDSENAGALINGQTFEHTFEIPGEYGYVCIPHETGGMVGTIEVTE